MNKPIDLRIPSRTPHKSPDISEGLRREMARRIFARLRASGRARTLSNAAISRIVGVSAITVAKWKAREESMDHLLAIADALAEPLELKIGVLRH